MKHKFSTALVLVYMLFRLSHLQADFQTGREKIAFRAMPFELENVRLLEGPFKSAMERDRKYLYSLDSDRLLHTWRLNAGLPSDAEPYGGWERPNCEVRGHTLGHYLSACALMFAGTGDEKLKQKAESIISELAECQKTAGENGYLSAFPESHIQRAEELKRVWAPYYVLHKIYAGLLDMYHYCGTRQALDIATKMGNWAVKRNGSLSEKKMQEMLNRTEQGGMNETLANLYSLTGNTDFLKLSLKFNQDRYVKPLAEKKDMLKGEHVNSFIPNIIGTARQYELTAVDRHRITAEYFWHQVTGARCYCTGGTSASEHWRGGPHKLSKPLDGHTQESCCTYNMLKLTRHLFCWNADVKYADYYERTLYNSILSTQNPETGMMMYFVPLGPGYWKMYNTPDSSFWCCTGTGLENHAKYGDSIYFHDKDTLYVNLFVPSRLAWRDKDITIVQKTEYPVEEGTTLTVEADKAVSFTMKVRIPWWAENGVSAGINGNPLTAAASPSSYLSVKRTWKNGDRLSISMPMSLYKAPMPDDKTLVAFMYGPLVLAGKLGGKGLTTESTHTTQNWYKFRDTADCPVFLTENDDIGSLVEKVKGKPLTFKTTGLEKAIELVPYHMLFKQKYAVYWRVYVKGSKAYKGMLRRKALEKEFLKRCVDICRPGDRQSETQHQLKGNNTNTGFFMSRRWRDAPGGWFSYEMKVIHTSPLLLHITYWGSDVGRVFDILVDGEKIATQKLQNNRQGKFFTVDYKLPSDLIKGKDSVTVTFKAHEKSTAGGVFGCAVIKTSD